MGMRKGEDKDLSGTIKLQVPSKKQGPTATATGGSGTDGDGGGNAAGAAAAPQGGPSSRLADAYRASEEASPYSNAPLRSGGGGGGGGGSGGGGGMSRSTATAAHVAVPGGAGGSSYSSPFVQKPAFSGYSAMGHGSRAKDAGKDGSKAKPGDAASRDGSGQASARFKGATSISSDAFFRDEKETSQDRYERRQKMAKFSGAQGISSDMYFDRAPQVDHGGSDYGGGGGGVNNRGEAASAADFFAELGAKAKGDLSRMFSSGGGRY